MSHGQEYRQLMLHIGKVSLARKMRKPYPLVIADNLILISTAALIAVIVSVVVYVQTLGSFGQSQKGDTQPSPRDSRDYSYQRPAVVGEGKKGT